MRSIVYSQTRNSVRIAQRGTGRWKYASPSAAVRWSSSKRKARQWSTPLAKQLYEAITTTGPIPLASFMRMCLTSDMGGYYMSSAEGRDQFGQKGDFITSPEISQIFGELIAVWFVAEWMGQGRRKEGVELIEIGPGRGTLMDDILRTMKNFKTLASGIEAVYLVEASPSLREAQRKLLCGNSPMTETEIGHRCISRYAGIPVIWTENIRFVPSNPEKTPFIVAHEFFDALPIHAFQSIAPSDSLQEKDSDTIQTPTGIHKISPEIAQQKKKKKGPQWREMVISPTPPDSTHRTLSTPKSRQTQNPPPEFQLTISQASTPHSLYLPEVSPRYRALKAIPDSLIEISPESHAYAQDFARRIGGSKENPKKTPSGAAIILDYGPLDTIPTNSLRGIKAHKRVSPLSEPGLVDLSADVDFVALAEAALGASEGVEVYGPVEQGDFLRAMGIEERAGALVKSIKLKEVRAGKWMDEGEEVVQRVDGAWKRLVERGGGGMGKVYKAMAIVPESGGTRRPVGFGGIVGG